MMVWKMVAGMVALMELKKEELKEKKLVDESDLRTVEL